MKKHLTKLCIALVAVLFFASCNSDEKQIKTVVLNYFTAVKDVDFKKAKEFATPETGKLLDMLASFVGQDPAAIESAKKESKNMEYEVTEVKLIDKENAEATFTRKDTTKKEEAKPETIKLKKIDGKWFVHQPKEGAGEEQPMEQTPVSDSTATPDTEVTQN